MALVLQLKELQSDNIIECVIDSYFLLLLLISIRSSTANSLPLIGSTPFSIMYFSIIRFSKIAPDDGDTTGCSGTSFDTTNKR